MVEKKMKKNRRRVSCKILSRLEAKYLCLEKKKEEEGKGKNNVNVRESWSCSRGG